MKNENKKVLYLEKRGIDFLASDDELRKISDVGNYRVCASDVVGKDGKIYFIEFVNYDRTTYRTTDSIGKPLKKPKIETVFRHALHVSTQYYDKEGFAWGNPNLDQKIMSTPALYTLENILKTANKISATRYDEIAFCATD